MHQLIFLSCRIAQNAAQRWIGKAVKQNEL